MICGGVASADFVLFRFSPSSKMGVVLEGNVDTSNNARLLTLRHEKYGEVILPRDQCKIYKAPDTRKKFKAQLKTAHKEENVEQLWKLAKESIRRGTAGNYFKAAEIIGDLDPDHNESARARRLAALIDAEIPESKDEETEMLKAAKVNIDMKFMRSPHYLLMQNLATQKRGSGAKTTRTEERFEIMEKVYNAYFAFFWSRGYEMPVPKKRMHVVLFETEQQFRDNSAQDEQAKPDNVVGYFDRLRNVSFFYEFRGSPMFRLIKKKSQELTDVGKERDVINRGDFVRMGKALNLLNEIMSEQQDISTGSHEVTHQLSHNSGLMPPIANFPRWAAEGFACYFESPKDAQWSGIGAVNEEQLSAYREARRSNHAWCRIEQVVSNRVFFEAKSHDDAQNAYALSWGVTHFLMERHFDRLMKYYEKLGKLPAKGKFMGPDEHEKLFFSCFTSEQRNNLDRAWDAYMRGLRTDFEVVTDRKLFED